VGFLAPGLKLPPDLVVDLVLEKGILNERDLERYLGGKLRK
jgi:hypothetical protein